MVALALEPAEEGGHVEHNWIRVLARTKVMAGDSAQAADIAQSLNQGTAAIADLVDGLRIFVG